ncbi:MAG TPA: ABC transporter permease [Bryobacteraceae bacterium]|nr:ABC transporter permease [Bryobacteraceae bacterium]
MWRRIGVIVRKEFSQLFRSPRTRTLLFIPPIIQLIVFGYAVNMDVDNVHMAWLDRDQSPASQNLLADFVGSGRFELVALPQTETDVQRLLDAGDVKCVVQVLPGFARDILRGRPTAVQILVDGTNSNTASLVSAYASQIVAAYAGSVGVQQAMPRVMARLESNERISLRAPSVEASTRVWFNPDLRSRNYFVPGVIANIIMVVTVMLTAMAIVREKEIGTMEQLIVTPIRPLELMIGKMLPAALVGLMDVTMISVGAQLIFHVPFRGAAVMLLACAALFLLTSLGAGLFISTIAQTQQQAMMSSTLFAAPTFMLSGFAFPIHNMPLPVQYFTYLNPNRYFVEILRSIFLKGAGLNILWPDMAALLAEGLAIMLLSSWRFRKRLD